MARETKFSKFHREFRENIHPDLQKRLEGSPAAGNVHHIIEHTRAAGIPAKEGGKAWSESLGFAFNPPTDKD